MSEKDGYILVVLGIILLLGSRLNRSPVIVCRSCPPYMGGTHTNARAGVPSPCHAIHGVAVVNRAKGYQIWRRGRTARPLLTDAPRIINCSGVALLHPPVYALEFRSLVAIW